MKPIIKWAGGKTSILKIIADYVYMNMDILYVEPFIGGGSVLFTFKPTRAVINDVNPNLMCMYHVVKFFPNELCYSLKKVHNIDKNIFINCRKRYNEIKFYESPIDFHPVNTERLVEIAFNFILLNKTCFNGLYRENNKGEFNVPYGKHTSFECDANNIIEISKYFNNNDIQMSCVSYDTCLGNLDTSKLTCIYLDPPYYECKESKFTLYSGLYTFGKEQHAQLYKHINKYSTESKGKWHIVCSNSYDDFTINQNLNYRLVEFSRSMDKKNVKEIISYTSNSTLWKDLNKYLIGKSKFESVDVERQFIKMYSSSVILNSAGRGDTFNIGKLGELHVKRVFAEYGIDLQKCPFKESIRPDGFVEIGKEKLIVEIKSRTYTCTGTASEKIDCIPRKLSLIYKKYGYKSIIIFVAGQIVEKSGQAFLIDNSDYVKSFKKFAETEAGIIRWLSIMDIPSFIKDMSN